MTTSRDLAPRLAALVMLLTLQFGCGADEPTVDPEPSTSSATETESSPTDEPTASPTELEVEAAAGPVIRTPVASLRAPEKWVTEGDELLSEAERAPKNEALLEKDVFGFINLYVDETDTTLTLDQAAKEATTYATTEGKRVEDRELGGEPAFVFTESLNAFGSTYYTIGLARDQNLVLLNFSLLGSDQRQRDAVIESVLATWEWQQ